MGHAVERGKILAYRIFDAGEEIALDVAEKLIPGAKRLEIASPPGAGTRIRAVLPCELPSHT